MTLTDKEVTAISLKFFGVHNFARAIEARVLEELRKQDLLKGMAEIRQAGYTDIVSDGGLDPRKAAPIPPTPTPSQEEANREASLYRWWKKNREVTLITAIYGNGCVNKTLADVEAFILARPDTEGSGK